MTLEGRRDKELAKQDIKFNPIENGERFELVVWCRGRGGKCESHTLSGLIVHLNKNKMSFFSFAKKCKI